MFEGSDESQGVKAFLHEFLRFLQNVAVVSYHIRWLWDIIVENERIFAKNDHKTICNHDPFQVALQWCVNRKFQSWIACDIRTVSKHDFYDISYLSFSFSFHFLYLLKLLMRMTAVGIHGVRPFKASGPTIALILHKLKHRWFISPSIALAEILNQSTAH